MTKKRYYSKNSVDRILARYKEYAKAKSGRTEPLVATELIANIELDIKALPNFKEKERIYEKKQIEDKVHELCRECNPSNRGYEAHCWCVHWYGIDNQPCNNLKVRTGELRRK